MMSIRQFSVSIWRAISQKDYLAEQQRTFGADQSKVTSDNLQALVILLFIGLLSIALTACGSSNNSSASTNLTTTSTNVAPVVEAGIDQTVSENQQVTLSGSANDADGNIVSYLWQQTLGTSVSLSNLDSASTSFIAPQVTQSSTLMFSLTVTDNGGKSAQDTITITVNPESENAAIDITNAILTNQNGSCKSYVGLYYSNVEDIQRSMDFNGDIVITTSEDKCIFAVNEIPNHDFNDASAAFATNVSEQSGHYEIPLSPVMANTATELSLSTTNALLLNGVVIDLLAAACYDVGNEPLGQEKIGCGEDQLDNPWRYDPMSSLNNFGTDEHNAHVQPDGTYHYHGNPVALFTLDCDIVAQESPVIGFAADGFPVYGSCFNDNGVIRKARSSYQLKNNGGMRQAVSGYTTPQAGMGSVASNNYDGQFRGDYQYVTNSGDLDQCNGMTINGQYGYYVTDSYPWVLGCYKGTPDNSMKKQGAAMVNRMHTHSGVIHQH